LDVDVAERLAIKDKRAIAERAGGINCGLDIAANIEEVVGVAPLVIVARGEVKHGIALRCNRWGERAEWRAGKMATGTRRSDDQRGGSRRFISRLPKRGLHAESVDSLDGKEAQCDSSRCVFKTLWQVRRPRDEVVFDTRCPFGMTVCSCKDRDGCERDH
jgi:hypothetical protein